MDFREMNRRVFDRKAIPHVFFQPRFEPWYAWHQTFHCLPPRYRGMSLTDLYDYVGASMRTVHYYTGQPDPIVRHFDRHVNVNEQQTGDQLLRTIDTPHGRLVERSVKTQDDTWREVDFPVKTPDDLNALRWLFQHTEYRFSAPNFEAGSAFLGPRGEPSFWVPKSPYQALVQQWMKMEDLIYALADCRDEVEQTMQAIDDSYDGLYEQLCSYGGLHILNFGENIHEQLLSPAYFERYLVPFFARRGGQLKRAGIYTHVHIDGYCRTLLPFFKNLAVDGIEAVTPQPQGDVTLAEVQEHIGDKILLDGIPAVLFLDTYSREELMRCAEEVVRLFHPRLVLGVSDEVPEGAGEEAIERVKMVADWCRRQTPGRSQGAP